MPQTILVVDDERDILELVRFNLTQAGFRVLTLSSELGDARLERALRALEPSAILLCGPGTSVSSAGKVLRKVHELGFDAPLYGYRVAGLMDSGEIPSAGSMPSEATGMLNSELRRRAARAFA